MGADMEFALLHRPLICTCMLSGSCCFWKQLSCLYVSKLTYCLCNKLQQCRAQHETLNSAAILGICPNSWFAPLYVQMSLNPGALVVHTRAWFAMWTKLYRTLVVRLEWKSPLENSRMRPFLSLCMFGANKATELEITVIKAWNEALGRSWVDSMS